MGEVIEEEFKNILLFFFKGKIYGFDFVCCMGKFEVEKIVVRES